MAKYMRLQFYSDQDLGTSLVVQWLRTCLPLQEMWFNPWSGKIPCALGQISQGPNGP